jgi:outer membrane immunogenic protein
MFAAAKYTLAAFAVNFASLPALAGDLTAPAVEPQVVAPAAAASSSIWNGFWLGLSLGQGSGNYDISGTVTQDNAEVGTLNLPDIGGTGGLFGAEIGWGHDFGNGWVAGAQLDYTTTSITSDAYLRTVAPAGFETTFKPKFIASGLLRLGYLVNDTTMVYGLAGESYGSFEGNLLVNYGPDSLQTDYGFGAFGTTLGAGIETRLSAKTSLKLEYRTSDFGDVPLGAGPIDIDNAYSASMATSTQTVRATLAIHF